MDDSGRSSQDFQNYVVIFFMLLIIGGLYFFYQPTIWHTTKSGLFSLLNAIPHEWHKWLFFYTQYNEAIPAIHDKLQNNSSVYFFQPGTSTIEKLAIDEASRWFTIPFVAPFIIYFSYRATKGGLGEFQSGVSLQRFAEIQSDIFVYIKPVVYNMSNIVKQRSLDKGDRAIAKIPAQWVKDNDLAVTAGKTIRESLTRKERKTLSLKEQKTFVKLRDDLGRVWRGLDELTKPELEVLSVIVPHVYGRIAESRIQNRFLSLAYSSDKSKEGLELVKYARDEVDIRLEAFKDEFRESFKMPHFDDSEFDDPYDPLLSAFDDVSSEVQLKEIGDDLVKDALLKHNYVATVIIALLVRAWKYGILSSAEMHWVRSTNRELWYYVSQTGRKSSFIECCAVWSHYKSEEAYGFKMIKPSVHPAIKGIDYEMWKTHENYLPRGDYNNTERWDKLVPKIEV